MTETPEGFPAPTWPPPQQVVWQQGSARRVFSLGAAALVVAGLAAVAAVIELWPRPVAEAVRARTVRDHYLGAPADVTGATCSTSASPPSSWRRSG